MSPRPPTTSDAAVEEATVDSALDALSSAVHDSVSIEAGIESLDTVIAVPGWGASTA